MHTFSMDGTAGSDLSPKSQDATDNAAAK